jgi:hypothetical protein
MKINGLPVKNAKKPVLLHILPKDIAASKSKKPDNCAAAVACKRQLGATEARVHVGRTFLRFNGHWDRYYTSKALRAEIVAFDRGGKFEPGEYMLSPVNKKRVKQTAYPKKTGKKVKKRAKYHVLTNIRPVGIYA